jgi:lipopolysaccharide export system protein LptA
MIKKFWGFILLLGLLLNLSIGWAAGELTIIAPRGGHFDLQHKVMKYYADGSRLVEARWKESLITGRELSDNRKTKKRAIPSARILKAFELTVDVTQNHLTASQKVTLYYDVSTFAKCNLLDWERLANFMKLTGQVMIGYQDWIIKGNQIDAHLDKGLFIVYGPVEAFNKLNSIHGGKLIFDQANRKAIISDNAVVTRGGNEMAAPEITYFFDTNQVLASGSVRTKIIDESE